MRRRGLRGFVGRQIVLHTVGGNAIRGVLLEEFADGLLLAAPEYLDEAKSIDMPGRAFFKHAQIDWHHIKDA